MFTVQAVVVAREHLYAVRGDGAVFVLLPRGDMLDNGTRVDEATWARCPAIPGTEAAVEQEG